jgi:hypothetical protein
MGRGEHPGNIWSRSRSFYELRDRLSRGAVRLRLDV